MVRYRPARAAAVIVTLLCLTVSACSHTSVEVGAAVQLPDLPIRFSVAFSIQPNGGIDFSGSVGIVTPDGIFSIAANIDTNVQPKPNQTILIIRHHQDGREVDSVFIIATAESMDITVNGITKIDVTSQKVFIDASKSHIERFVVASGAALPITSGSSHGPGAASLPFDNVGISNDADPAAGNLDGTGYSYSAAALAAAGLTPGRSVTHDGLTFTWPDVLAGMPDNVLASGQTIAISGSGTLGFLGASDYYGSSGTGTITYTDGTTQSFTLSLADWWANAAASGSDILASVPYMNTSNGQMDQEVSVYYAAVPLEAGKTVQSVTLPDVSQQAVEGSPAMHVFAMTISSPSNITSGSSHGPGAASLPFDNVGISNDADPAAGNLDGTGYSYSAAALAAAGLTPGRSVTHDGLTFTWPDVLAGMPDNVLASGQTIAISGSGTLGFLGASDYYGSSGTGTITYTDGTTQSFTLSLADWWANAAASGSDILASVPYMNTSNGQMDQEVSVYYAAVPLEAGKTVQSVTLPDVSQQAVEGSPAMHVFAMTISSPSNGGA